MPSEFDNLPEGWGPYEKWPGYKSLVIRLTAFMEFLQQKDTGFMAVDFRLVDQPPCQMNHIAADAKTVELVIPKNKSEFEKSGHRIRIAFTLADDEWLRAAVNELSETLVPKKVRSVALWAHSGVSNDVLAAYQSMALNPESNRSEIVMINLGGGRYEFGFDAHGNLLDKLLLDVENLIRDEMA